MKIDNYLFDTIKIVLSAGKKILKIYNTDILIDYKSDKSPVTNADLIANKFILFELQKFNLPIVSEESVSDVNSGNMDLYWLVDPLDGTKEFINNNDDFTVNVALIEFGVPILGVVFAPAVNECFFGSINIRSKHLKIDIISENIPETFNELITKSSEIENNFDENFNVLVSRSHLNSKTLTFVDKISLNRPVGKLIKMGSSLKICKLAQGLASIYPRFESTKIWDTAAGHAILNFAGGSIKSVFGEELIYNHNKIDNPDFIAKKIKYENEKKYFSV
tara:strand:- start:449 stop:1279 length:831 start_codon:yes stop_codon:yes gene_type:complete